MNKKQIDIEFEAHRGSFTAGLTPNEQLMPTAISVPYDAKQGHSDALVLHIEFER